MSLVYHILVWAAPLTYGLGIIGASLWFGIERAEPPPYREADIVRIDR